MRAASGAEKEESACGLMDANTCVGRILRIEPSILHANPATHICINRDVKYDDVLTERALRDYELLGRRRSLKLIYS